MFIRMNNYFEALDIITFIKSNFGDANIVEGGISFTINDIELLRNFLKENKISGEIQNIHPKETNDNIKMLLKQINNKE